MSGEYTRINVANNAETELDAAITDEDTSISVLDAGVFASAPMQLTLIDADGNLEIVEVGNVDEANNNLENVTRGVDGTTAQSFDAGSLVEDRLNRGTYNELVGEEGFEAHDHAEAEFQQVPNAGLVNDSVTVTAGNALENGGTVALGETITVDVETDGIATDELDLSITPTWTGNHSFEAGLDVDADITDGETVIWDNTNQYLPQGRLENDTLTVAGNTVSLGGSTDVNYTDLENREHGNEDHDVNYTDYDSNNFDTDFEDKTTDDLSEGTSNEYFKQHGNEDHNENYTTTDEDVENFSTSGTNGTVPVSQGDGTLAMKEMDGGIEFLDDINEQLQNERKAFNTIRNRRDWIEYILNKDETKADEITSSQVLTNYVFEAENDKYDRFIDPNIALGMMAFNQENEPSLTNVYEVALFFAPSTFLEGLMSYEDLAEHITGSEVLMDGIMEGDHILENQFGKTANA